MGLTFPRYPRKRLRSSTAIRTRGGIPHLPSPVLRCDDPFERCNRVDRHQPTRQSAHDSTGRDPRDDCSVLQPLRHWDVCTGRDRWRREGECLDGSSLEHVRVPACSFREPHGICNLRIGPVMANECDPFIETSRAASRAGTVVRLPIILRIRSSAQALPPNLPERPLRELEPAIGPAKDREPKEQPPGFAADLQGPSRSDNLIPALSQLLRGAKFTKEPQRTKLGAMGEYYRAFVVMEEPVTKWPARRDEVEYDVLRVSVNMRTN